MEGPTSDHGSGRLPRVSFPQIITKPDGGEDHTGLPKRREGSLEEARPRTKGGKKAWSALLGGKRTSLDVDDEDDDDDDDDDDEDDFDPRKGRKRNAMCVSLVLLVSVGLAAAGAFLSEWFIAESTWQTPEGKYVLAQEHAGLLSFCTSYTYYPSLRGLIENAGAERNQPDCTVLFSLQCSEFASTEDKQSTWNRTGTSAPTQLPANVVPATSEDLERKSAVHLCQQQKTAFIFSTIGVIGAFAGIGAQMRNSVANGNVRTYHSVTFATALFLTVVQLAVFYLTIQAQVSFQSLGRTSVRLGTSFFLWVISLIVNFVMCAIIYLLWPPSEAFFDSHKHKAVPTNSSSQRNTGGKAGPAETAFSPKPKSGMGRIMGKTREDASS
ncbi:hypothetical protein BJ742DRAFT_772350 [Cladochytrium replicatum]|nr:hypothetical protein BJ742DRAFT_772350 [Cladochytrium replicatum]